MVRGHISPLMLAYKLQVTAAISSIVDCVAQLWQGRIDPPEAGEGHATPIEPVQMAKCWRLLKIEPSLSLKPAKTPGQNL